MRFFDYIRLAIKNLTRQKSRTILTIVAITVGSLSVILMISLLISVRLALIDQFQDFGAFNLVTVTRDPNATDNQQLITSGNNSPSDEGKLIDDTALASFKKITNVVDATPILGVWIKTIKLEGADKKMWSNIIGYNPSSNVFDLPILAGRDITSSDMDKVVVGMRFAKTYGFNSNPSELIGKKAIFSMESGGGSAPDWGPLPEKPPQNADKEWWDEQNKKGREIPVEIIGVADNANMDDSQNYINITWAKRLMTSVSWQWSETNKQDCQQGNCQSVLTLIKDDSNFTKSGYGSVIINVNDTANLQAVADQISKLGYGVTTAQTMLDQINRMMLMIGIVLGVIGGISLFVAAIGIINTMVMATYERIREIGVMRACGATRAVIRRLFTFEAAILGFLGGVLGIIISYGLIYIAKILVDKYSASLGSLPIDRIGSFPWWLILSVVAFTTLVGLLSGLGPAIKAAKLNPVEALRYE